MPSCCEICCEIMIAILFPPLGVCIRHGCCTVSPLSFFLLRLLLLVVEFCICLLLTMMGYIPGIIYALYAIIFINHDESFHECRRRRL
ncbi:hypothetical protein DVH24_028961 [Malus domestica]|uniref:Hydrophobic protein OSR8 n=1 Tax=Malus domestica TaxID=3750 RepID=A0A498HU00_MALDO|nr:hypothetical protein DVH24_028961 [Malus domestica]